MAEFERRTHTKGSIGALALGALLACSPPGAPGPPASRGVAPSALPAALSPALVVSENRIRHADGRPFRGHGVNLHDTRSCNSCVSGPSDAKGLARWADELVETWHVTFVRFLLSSWASDDGYRVQYRRLVDDPAYALAVREVVTHLTDKGVYVLVSVFADPSMLPDSEHPESEWPTLETLPVYALLAEMFHNHPRVLFGLGNEPHGPKARNDDLAKRYLSAIDVIRGVEQARGVEPHVVVVPAPQAYARDVSYFVEHPLPRPQVAYEIHPYDHVGDFERLVTQPSRVLPLVVGEYGPTKDMTARDVEALWLLLEQLGLPHTAWNFHARCGPTMIEEDFADGCGLSRPREKPFVRTPWGEQVFTYFQGKGGRSR